VLLETNNLALEGPVLLIGVGGAGSRITADACKGIKSRCALVSDDLGDFVEGHRSVLISAKSWVNPSAYKLRYYAQGSTKRIRSLIHGFKTVVVVANLAGKCGSAIAPVVCKLAKRESNCNTLISIVIMPFRFEKDRIFQAAVSLKRIRESSDAIVVIDNDSFLDNNPELSAEECYQLTNPALSETIGFICRGQVYGGMSFLCSGNSAGGAEMSTKDSVAMLYPNNSSGRDKSAMLYVIGGKKVPLGLLNSLVNTLRSIYGDEINSGATVVISNLDNTNVHLLASFGHMTRFDDYDPLSQIIPSNNVLDWEEMDCSPEIEMSIANIE
jgi:cell division protein FtsZ